MMHASLPIKPVNPHPNFESFFSPSADLGRRKSLGIVVFDPHRDLGPAQGWEDCYLFFSRDYSAVDLSCQLVIIYDTIAGMYLLLFCPCLRDGIFTRINRLL